MRLLTSLAAVCLVFLLLLLWRGGRSRVDEVAGPRPLRPTPAAGPGAEGALSTPPGPEEGRAAGGRLSAGPAPEPDPGPSAEPEEDAPPALASLRLLAVSRETEEPLPGVRVFLDPVVGAAPRRALVPHAVGTPEEALLTDELGEALFTRVPAGRAYRVGAWSELHDRRTEVEVAPLPAWKEGSVRLVLSTQNDTVYHGRIVSGATEAPPWPVPPTAQLWAGEHLLAIPTVARDGRFSLETDSWRSPFVLVRAAGHTPLLVPVTAEHPTPAEAELLRLGPSAELLVCVANAAGFPAPTLTVHLDLDPRAFAAGKGEPSVVLPHVGQSGTTGLAGCVSFTDVPAGAPIAIRVEGDPFGRFGASTPALLPGESREVALSAPGPQSISGRVVDQHGDPVPHQALWVRRVESSLPRLLSCLDRIADVAIADGAGNFSTGAVYPGTYLVGPARECEGVPSPLTPWPQRPTRNPTRAGGLGTIVLVARAPTEEVVVHVDRELYLSGRVVDGAGFARPAARVVARRVDRSEGDPPAVLSGGDGGFVLGPVSAGSFELFAVLPGQRSEPMLAAAGAEELELVLRETGLLRGHVRAAWNDQPLPAHALATLYLDGLALGRAEAQTGAFAVEVPTVGEFVLTARWEQGRGETRVFAPSWWADVDGLEVRVRVTAPLELFVSGGRGPCHYRATMGGQVVAEGEFQGLRHRLELPPGHVVLELDTAGARAREELELDPGGDTLWVRLQP